MELNVIIKKSKAIIEVGGVITTENASDFHAKLNEVLASGIKKAEFNFSACKIICSTGIGKMILFAKEFANLGGKVAVTKCSPNVYELFQTIKLDLVMPVKQ